MTKGLRGELAVLVLGAAMWVTGAIAPGEWGRAFTGGGLVFTVSGLALVAVSLIRGRMRDSSRSNVPRRLDAQSHGYDPNQHNQIGKAAHHQRQIRTSHFRRLVIPWAQPRDSGTSVDRRCQALATAPYDRLGVEQWPLRAETYYRRAVIHTVWTDRGGGRCGACSNNQPSRALPRSLP